jgi:acid phosphatase class B
VIVLTKRIARFALAASVVGALAAPAAPASAATGCLDQGTFIVQCLEEAVQNVITVSQICVTATHICLP